MSNIVALDDASIRQENLASQELIDHGPLTCQLFKDILTMKKEDTGVLSLLQEVDPEDRLLKRINEWNELPETFNARKKAIIRDAAINWVHFATASGFNKDMFMRTLPDTRIALQQKKSEGTRQWLTLRLLLDTPPPNSTFTSPALTVDKLKSFHRSMLRTELSSAGAFRRGPFYRRSEYDNEPKLCIQHSLIDDAMTMLCKYVSDFYIAMLKSDKPQSAVLGIALSIAKFAVTHILNICPFQDGNWLIANFVGYYLISAFMPFPIHYHQIDGWNPDRDEIAPSFDEWGDSAEACAQIKYYTHLAVSFDYDQVIAASTEAELESKLAKAFVDTYRLVFEWSRLREGESVVVSTQLSDGETPCRAKLLRLPEHVQVDEDFGTTSDGGE